MYQFYFLKLDVWKNSKDLSKEIYKITKLFPDEEKYNLVSQLRSAATSIGSNVAEGSSRSTGKEQARFTDIAYGSLMEVLNLLILSQELDLIEEELQQKLQQNIEVIARQLIALRKTQRSLI